MDLTPTDKDRIVRALAVALPAWKQRADVAAAAGLSDVQLAGDPRAGWATLVDEAMERGRLVPLVQAAAQARPGARPLARLAEALAAGRRPPAPPRALVAGLSLLAVVGAGWLVLGRGGEAPEVAAEAGVASEPTVEPSAPTEASAPVEAPAPAEVPAPVEAPAPAEAPDPAEPAEVEAPAVVTPPVAPPPVAKPAPTPVGTTSSAPTPPRAADGSAVAAGPGRCAGKSGWAHLGERTSLRAGDTWVVAGGANVRADRPREENGWAWRHPLVCTLLAGDRVALTQDPVSVPGGAVWVWVDAGAAPR